MLCLNTNIVAILICQLTFTDVWTEAPRDTNWRKKQKCWRVLYMAGNFFSRWGGDVVVIVLHIDTTYPIMTVRKCITTIVQYIALIIIR